MSTPEEAAANRSAQNWTHTGPSTPFLASLLHDPRMHALGQSYLGDDCIGAMANGSSTYRRVTHWHSDMPHAVCPLGAYTGLKIFLYAQALTETTGALRVVPGSHANPLHSDIAALFEQSDSESSKLKHKAILDTDEELSPLPGHVVATQPGDAICMDLHTWHAAWGGGDDRRFYSLEYFEHPRHALEPRYAFEQLACTTMLHPHWVHQATESAPGSLPAKWLQAIRDAGRNEFGQWGEQSMFRSYRKAKGIEARAAAERKTLGSAGRPVARL